MNPKNSKATELWFPDNSDSPCTLLLDLSRASTEDTEPSPQYYCRTWDPTTKDPGVRVGILDSNRLTDQAAFLGGSGITHHFLVMKKTTQLAPSMERGFRGLEAFHDKQTIVHRVISMDGKVGATGIGLDGRRTPSGSYETSSCPR
ncbi:hypothetical protein JCM18909_3897 [Cutibacterium acnes JCM 18909]|nr:hypothetical protein JCM18909_3897 [Cutibacterium acnes JCM 18909]